GDAEATPAARWHPLAGFRALRPAIHTRAGLGRLVSPPAIDLHPLSLPTPTASAPHTQVHDDSSSHLVVVVPILMDPVAGGGGKQAAAGEWRQPAGQAVDKAAARYLVVGTAATRCLLAGTATALGRAVGTEALAVHADGERAVASKRPRIDGRLFRQFHLRICTFPCIDIQAMCLFSFPAQAQSRLGSV
ncbi:unnamed protein product, partial [Urochloa humidicola]